jgi:exosome complex component RRP46
MVLLTTTRPDGRELSSLRPLSCELSTLKNADGSSSWKSGSTHVLAAVHGPIAPRAAQHEKPDATLSVLLKSGNDNLQEWELLLTNVLTSSIQISAYPRSVIQIVLQIVQEDGSVLAACLHAAVSALMDAGIHMMFLPTATTCLVTNDGIIQLDPIREEEQIGSVVVLVTSSDSTLLGSYTSKLNTSLDTLLQCLQVAFRARSAVIAFWRLVIEQKTTRECQTLWVV